MKKHLVALAVAALCSACAIIPEQVDVAYAPDPMVARSAVATPAAVGLQVTDARRAESPTWIADKKNGYGMRMASVLAQKPVADLIKDALTQELVARGVQVGAGPTLVTVEVTRMESVYQNRFFSIGAIGTADLSVQVRRPDGAIAYARTFSVSNDDEASVAGTAGQARRSIEGVLSKVVGQIMSDPGFLGALSTVPRMS